MHRIYGVLLAALLPSGVALGQDANGNALRDSIDLRNGTSLDCNHNGVPDEADIAKPDFRAAIEHFGDAATLNNVSGTWPLDVDHDLDLDLVVASSSGPSNSNLTIWRNDGGAGLVYSTRTTLLNSVCSTVRTGDLNGDGWTDVVAADSGFPQVIVMLATGAGTFSTPVRLVAASRGTGLAIADLDNDGDIDIAMPGFASNAVDVFRNNGTGGFGPKQTFACGAQPVAVSAADFNGDGLRDLAVANSFISSPGVGTVSLLRNTGNAAFVTHSTLTILGHAETATSSRPHDLVLADVDSDSDADLLVCAKSSNSIRIYSNDGLGAFTNTQTLGPLESVGGIADRFICENLDSDTAPELAWCDSAARAVRLYDNAAGTFVYSQAYGAGTEGPIAVSAGDLTGDGLPEIVTAGNASNAFSTFKNEGELNFDAVGHIRRLDSNFYPRLGEFTGDLLTDILTYSTFDNPASIRIAPGVGDARFGTTTTIPLSTSGTILPRDLNHDGHLDLLSIGGHCFVKFSNGDGTFGPEISSNVYVYANAITADVNSDGNLDLLWQYAVSPNEPSWVRISLGNSKGLFAPFYEVDTPRFLGSIWTGDLSGDGAPELFVGLGGGAIGDPAMETFIVYPNLGDGTFGPYSVYANELNPNFSGGVGGFAWVDIDGDGDNDLLGQSTRTWLFRNNKHQLATPVMLGGFANYAWTDYGAAIFDADGDGDLDFYGARSVSGISSPAIFFNDGNGGFGEGDVGPCLAVMRYRASPDVLLFGDADNNGRVDILAKPNGYADWYLHLNLPQASSDCDGDSVPNECDADACSSGNPSDLNLDGVVNAADLAILLSAWETPDAAADINRDGIVNAADLSVLLSSWS